MPKPELTATAATPVPLLRHVELDTKARLLILHWPDGQTSRLAHDDLRAACMCAQCRRERLACDAIQTRPATLLTEVRPMGYGVQLVFDDGHDRGIYPWTYLEALCRAEMHG
jgi:DUF971 family protein